MCSRSRSSFMLYRFIRGPSSRACLELCLGLLPLSGPCLVALSRARSAGDGAVSLLLLWELTCRGVCRHELCSGVRYAATVSTLSPMPFRPRPLGQPPLETTYKRQAGLEGPVMALSDFFEDAAVLQ